MGDYIGQQNIKYNWSSCLSFFLLEFTSVLLLYEEGTISFPVERLINFKDFILSGCQIVITSL